MKGRIMTFPDSDPAKLKKLLIITSSGGGGLIQAANAKEQEARARNPNLIVIRKDVLKDWMGKIFGRFCLERWNRAQINGDVAALRFFIAAQYFFDYLCWPHLFICTLYTLFKEDVDHVIDTQPMGTSAILKALRIYNYRRKKQVFLQKVLVDLPTKAATHFFRPIKRLTRKDRPHLKLTTIAPLLEEGQTAETFWQTNCRLSEKEIHYEDVNVRQSFRKYQHRPKKADDLPLFLRYKSEEELQLMQKTCAKGSLRGVVKGDRELHFSISPNSRVITVLLGSQPANEATFNYVKKFIQIAREPNFPKEPCHLFVFCSEHIPGQQQSLFRKVVEYVDRIKKYPSLLTIVPFSFQNDDVIAPLFFRSDLTCTRSGGQTAMELMCVSSGEIWIHSETKKEHDQKEQLSLEQLLEGIPGWEAANALYLQKIRNAKVVTPETFAPNARRFFRINEQTDQSNRALASTA